VPLGVSFFGELDIPVVEAVDHQQQRRHAGHRVVAVGDRLVAINGQCPSCMSGSRFGRRGCDTRANPRLQCLAWRCAWRMHRVGRRRRQRAPSTSRVQPWLRCCILTPAACVCVCVRGGRSLQAATSHSTAPRMCSRCWPRRHTDCERYAAPWWLQASAVPCTETVRCSPAAACGARRLSLIATSMSL
jgi:hypothetical protein